MGQQIVGTATVLGTTVTALVSGTGGVGTYTISPAQTPASGLTTTVYSANSACNIWFMGDSTSTEANDATLYSEARAWTYPGGEWGNCAILGNGVNGTTCDAYSQDTAPDATRNIPAALATKPDLIILSLGINDMRANGHSQAQLTACLTALVNRLRAGTPTTDIILRVPNTLGTTDINSQGFVSAPNPTIVSVADNSSGLYRLTLGGLFPTDLDYTASMLTGDSYTVSGAGCPAGAVGTFSITVIDTTHVDLQGSSFSGSISGSCSMIGVMSVYGQRYSAEMRAAYLSLVNLWPNVTVVDMPQLVFGTTAQAASQFMNDQLHPNNTGYALIARELVRASSRKLPFSPRQALLARLTSPTTPWTAYPREVEDPNFYTPIVRYGRLNSAISAGASSLDIDFGVTTVQSVPAPYSTDWSALGVGLTMRDSLSTLPGDVVQIGTSSAFQLPQGSSAALASPSLLRLLTLGSSVPSSLPAGLPVSIWRPKYYFDANLQTFMGQTKSWPSVTRVGITGNTNGFITFQSVAGDPPIWQHLPESGDTLIVPGNSPITLAMTSPVSAAAGGVTVTQSGTDFSALTFTQGGGNFGFLFSARPQKAPQEMAARVVSEIIVTGTLTGGLVGKGIARLPAAISATETIGKLGTAGTVQGTNVNVLKNGSQVATCNFAISATTCTLSATIYVTAGDRIEADVAQAGTSAADLYLVFGGS